MANNPYINKVIYGGNVLFDLTSTTATKDTILSGYGAYGADGAWVDGEMTGGGIGAVYQDEDGYIVLDDGEPFSRTLSITENGTYNVAGYGTADVSVAGGAPTLETISKTYTPSTVQQTETITPSVGYDGIGEVDVTVSAVPMGNKGSSVISTNSAAYGGQYYITTFSYPNATSGYYQYQDINAISITLTNESKTITPSETVQTVIPTSTTRYLSAVTVNAISSAYVGTGVPRKSASDMTFSGATVFAPSGYYSSTASYQLPSVSAHTYHPSTADQTIASQAWLTGAQTLKSVVTANIVASNIASGVTVTVGDADDPDRVLSVTGTYEGGGGSTVKVDTISSVFPQTNSVTISGLKGEPTSFYLFCDDALSTTATARVVAIAYDGTNITGEVVSNASNAIDVNTAFTKAYSNGTLTITSTGSAQFAITEYILTYSYGGSASAVGTKNVQVGSGATSISFTGLPMEPLYWSCIFTSGFSTSSGYQRVVAVCNNSSAVTGVAMDSSTHALTAWTQTYNNGTLTITSNGTNNGGYFHQPGYYQLTYVTDENAPHYETKSVTFTPTTVQQSQTVTASSGYDALEAVNITVNAIPGEYVIPTGNLPITQNGNNINVASYATVSVNVSGGAGWQVDTKTITTSDYPVSISFTSMKGQPHAFFLKSTTQISSSGSTTYYYIIDMRYNGTNTAGNCFRIGSTRRVDTITSGYTWSYINSTLTVNSSAASRSASPGAFNGSYELVYFY